MPVLTALLGALVALAEGWRQIARYDEGWAAYRVASERMKREQQLYVNGAGEYHDLADEEAAFLRFVEAIVAEEQRIYWKSRGEGATSTSRATAPVAAGTQAATGRGAGTGGEPGRGHP